MLSSQKLLLPACALWLLLAPCAAVAEERDGESVYRNVCQRCHDSGEHGAPRIDDRKRWHKLRAEGLDDLVPAALAGLRKMPAKGGEPTLSTLETARAVIYLATATGGQFAEPSATDLTRWQQKAERRKKK